MSPLVAVMVVLTLVALGLAWARALWRAEEAERRERELAAQLRRLMAEAAKAAKEGAPLAWGDEGGLNQEGYSTLTTEEAGNLTEAGDLVDSGKEPEKQR